MTTGDERLQAGAAMAGWMTAQQRALFDQMIAEARDDIEGLGGSWSRDAAIGLIVGLGCSQVAYNRRPSSDALNVTTGVMAVLAAQLVDEEGPR